MSLVKLSLHASVIGDHKHDAAAHCAVHRCLAQSVDCAAGSSCSRLLSAVPHCGSCISSRWPPSSEGAPELLRPTAWQGAQTSLWPRRDVCWISLQAMMAFWVSLLMPSTYQSLSFFVTTSLAVIGIQCSAAANDRTQYLQLSQFLSNNAERVHMRLRM